MASTVRCSICLQDCSTDSDKTWSVVKDCGHFYHTECLQQWLEHNRNCPNCRAPVSTSSRQPGFCTVRPDIVTYIPTPGGPLPGTSATYDADAQQRVAALLQKLRERTAELDEVRQHKQEERDRREALEAQLLEAKQGAAAAKEKAERDLQAKRTELHDEKRSKENSLRVIKQQKLELERARTELRHLQREAAKEQLMTNRQLTKRDMDVIASRVLPDGPELTGREKDRLQDFKKAIAAHNAEYSKLVQQIQAQALEASATEREVEELRRERTDLKAQVKRLEGHIAELNQAARRAQHPAQHEPPPRSAQPSHLPAQTHPPAPQRPLVCWDTPRDEDLFYGLPSSGGRPQAGPRVGRVTKAAGACAMAGAATKSTALAGYTHGWQADGVQQQSMVPESDPLIALDTCMDDYMPAEPCYPVELLDDLPPASAAAQDAQRGTAGNSSQCAGVPCQQPGQQQPDEVDPDQTQADESEAGVQDSWQDGDVTDAESDAAIPHDGSEDPAALVDQALAYLEDQASREDPPVPAHTTDGCEGHAAAAGVGQGSAVGVSLQMDAGMTDVCYQRGPLPPDPPVASTSAPDWPAVRRRTPLREKIRRLNSCTASPHASPAKPHAAATSAAEDTGRGYDSGRPLAAKTRITLPMAPAALQHSGRSTAQQGQPQPYEPEQEVWDLSDEKENLDHSKSPLTLAAALRGERAADAGQISAGADAHGAASQLAGEGTCDAQRVCAGHAAAQPAQHAQRTQAARVTHGWEVQLQAQDWQESQDPASRSSSPDQVVLSQPGRYVSETSQGSRHLSKGWRPDTRTVSRSLPVERMNMEHGDGRSSASAQPSHRGDGSYGEVHATSSCGDEPAGPRRMPAQHAVPGGMPLAMAGGLGFKSQATVQPHHRAMAAAVGVEKSFLPSAHSGQQAGGSGGSGTFIRHGPDGRGNRALVVGNVAQAAPRRMLGGSTAFATRPLVGKKGGAGTVKRGRGAKQGPGSAAGNIRRFLAPQGQ